MKKIGIALFIALGQIVLAEEKTVTGTVTYVAAGTVYTSLGRESGAKDSTLVYVKSASDTLGILQVFAVSSKSSACRIVTSKREIKTGDSVVARMVVEPPKPAPAVAQTQSGGLTSEVPGIRSKAPVVSGPVEVRGRVSAQYYVNRYDNPLYNTTQPGVVINLRARSTDIPLKFELYSNIRRLSYGNTSPFSSGATDQSRIYGLNLEYSDGKNDLSFGRIIPTMAPSVGYIDGVLLARKVGVMTFGSTLGYQPSYALQGISTDYKKFAFFASVQPSDSMNMTVSTAYARTYYLNVLDREVVSGNVSLYTLDGFQVYGYSEFDLRKASLGQFKMSPALTSLFANVSYRLTPFLSLGVGMDASRPLYTFSVARFIPDSLRETRLRSGITTTVSLYFPGGIMLSNTYSPRTSESPFASVYTNYTILSVADFLSSGVSVRSNFNLNANQYSTSNGYGVTLQRNIMMIADLDVRYQQNAYTLKNYDGTQTSRTVGSDLIINLARGLGLMVTYDRLTGYGMTSNSIFGEFSVRF